MTEGRKLPVWATIIGAYTFVFRNWREALRIGWLPLGTAILLDYLVELLPSDDGLPTFALLLYSFAIDVAYIPVVAMAVVPWHRLVLLRRLPAGLVAVALTRREWRYVMLSIAISAIIISLTGAATAIQFVISGVALIWSSLGILMPPIGIIIVFAVVLAAFYLFGLLGLALPAVAVDRHRGFRGAIVLGRGNGNQLFFVMLGVFVPVVALYRAVGMLSLPGDAYWGFAWFLVYDILFVFEFLVAATALSLCYKALGGMGAAEPGQTAIPPSSNA